METTQKFSVSLIGEDTAQPFNGDFVVKTVLTRRELFLADERRRIILGMVPAGVPASISGEAYMLGQLHVRIVSAPDWWNKSEGGLDIADANVIGEVFRLALEKEEERKKALQENSKAALDKISKSASKRISAQTEKTE